MRKRLQKAPRTQVRVSEVADRADCSTATVSRVLNEPERVTPAIRERVLVAMRELGYIPNSAARMLRSQRSHMMGIIIPTLSHAIYARMVEALQRRLAQHGYSLLLATSEYDLDGEVKQARLLVQRGVEGLVFVGNEHRPDLYELLRQLAVPYVNTYVYATTGNHPCVGFDNRLATIHITEFLLALGHRRFGIITAPLRDNDRASERVAGVRRALQANGLAVSPQAIYERPYGIASGREGLRYLRSLRPAPTAIVCGNDVMAMGALAEARALGMQVPGELSIVGFDDLEFAAHLDPPLTTMEVPAAQMGERAADFLLARVHSQTSPELIAVAPRLIVRGTTAIAPDRDSGETATSTGEVTS